MHRKATTRPRVVELHRAGRSNREIAEALGLTYGNVGSVIHRARQKGELPSFELGGETASERWNSLRSAGAAPPLGSFRRCLDKLPAADADALLDTVTRADETLLDALLRIALTKGDRHDAHR
jgi:hypothetical protein